MTTRGRLAPSPPPWPPHREGGGGLHGCATHGQASKWPGCRPRAAALREDAAAGGGTDRRGCSGGGRPAARANGASTCAAVRRGGRVLRGDGDGAAAAAAPPTRQGGGPAAGPMGVGVDGAAATAASLGGRQHATRRALDGDR
eukprot:scaffold137_cov398-Prasinococcus_capsulatus_cf.AAC.8